MIKCYHKDIHVEKGLKTKYLLWIKIDGARDGHSHYCDAIWVKMGECIYNVYKIQ